MSRQMSGASYTLGELSMFVHVLKSEYSIHVFCKTTSCHIGYHNEKVKYPLVMMGFVLQNGSCSLGAASNVGHLDVVKALMEAGANINQADKVSIHTPTVYDIIACDHCTCDPPAGGGVGNDGG